MDTPATVALCLLAPVVAYLLGSVSWAYVIGRLARGIDMTSIGDARIGAAFSVRMLGLGWGLLVGLLDMAKGAAAVALPLALGLPGPVTFLAGLAVVAGHNWSIFLKFRGGRGAAATFGLLAVLAIVPLLAGGVIVALPHYLTRRWMFIRGMRRTTVIFGAWMVVVSLVWWGGPKLGLDTAAPWAAETTPLLAMLPPCLLVLNVLKRA